MGRVVLVAIVLAAAALAQTPTGGLTGTIADAVGASIPKAKITISGLSARTETTNKEGEFLIAGLEPGPYQLSITAPGFLPTQISGRVEANQTTALGEIRMQVRVEPCDPWIQPKPTVVIRKRENRQRGILIAGTVRDWGKSPIERAIVKIRIFGEPDAPEAVVKTNQTGGFEITGLMPGTYVLSVESDGYNPVRIRQIVVGDGFEVHIDDIVMGASVEICL